MTISFLSTKAMKSPAFPGAQAEGLWAEAAFKSECMTQHYPSFLCNARGSGDAQVPENGGEMALGSDDPGWTQSTVHKEQDFVAVSH